jgi:hypothetical protein
MKTRTKFQLSIDKAVLNWRLKRIAKRLPFLIADFLTSLFFTLVILASSGAFAFAILSPGLATSCIEFLSLVYLLLLSIMTVRNFDREKFLHTLEELVDAVEHSNGTLTTDNINCLTQAIDELRIRLGMQ